MQFLAQKFKSRSTARRHRISVIRTVRTNERGFVKDEAKVIGTYWASVTPLTEALRIQFETMKVTATHSISMDSNVDVKETDKLKLGSGREFDILTIKRVDEGNRDLVIITEEIRPKNTISIILPKPDPEIDNNGENNNQDCNSNCNCNHGDNQIVVVGEDPNIFTFHNPPWETPNLGWGLKYSVYEGAQFPLITTLKDVSMETVMQVLHDVGMISPIFPRLVKVIYTNSNVQYGNISSVQGMDDTGWAGGGTLYFKGPIEFIIGWMGYGWRYPSLLHEILAVKTNGRVRSYVEMKQNQANAGDYGFEIWD
jgi:head-tail adaptor